MALACPTFDTTLYSQRGVLCCDTVTVSPEFAAAIDGGSKGATVINAELALIKREGTGEYASDKLAEDDFLLLRQVVYFETTCVAVAVEAGPTRQLIRALQAYGLGSLEEAASIYGTVMDIGNGLVHEGLHANSTFTHESCILGAEGPQGSVEGGGCVEAVGSGHGGGQTTGGAAGSR